MRRLHLASTAAALAATVLASPSTADPLLDAATVERLRPVVPAAIEYFADHSDDPLPGLDAQQVNDLLEGGVVRFRRRTGGDSTDPPERVTGYRIVARPRAWVWVAALDPGFRATDLLTEHRLRRDSDGTVLWHQYLSLPWPIADRQWVIEVGVRDELAHDTDDLIWEQFWKLAPDGEEIARRSIAAGNLDGITAETARDAVYVPANEGAWILFRLEENVTLVAYRVIARVGGHIPDSWIASFGMNQLSGILDAVAEHAAEAPQFYDPKTHPITGGDGEVIGKL